MFPGRRVNDSNERPFSFPSQKTTKTSETQTNTAMVEPMKERLSKLLTSQDMSDITLIVGSEPHLKSFKLHKLLLSMFSEVFHAMFFGTMAELKNEIKLPGDDVTAFEIVITYIYTGEIHLYTLETAVSVYRTSDKYMFKELKEKCIDYLLKDINVEMAIEIYELATATLEYELQKESWRYIERNASSILKEPSFRNAQTTTLLKLLQNERLIVKTEVEVYEALVLWGKERCMIQEQSATPPNIRQHILTLLPEIRFLSMTPVQFVHSPARDNILSESEQLMILKNILVPGAGQLPVVCHTSTIIRSQSAISSSMLFKFPTEFEEDKKTSGGSEIKLIKKYTFKLSTSKQEENSGN